MIDWKERYMREVEGLNNEGDPIGGDPPSGLRHQVETLKAALAAQAQQESQAKRLQAAIEGECGGLAIDLQTAKKILNYVLLPAQAQKRVFTFDQLTKLLMQAANEEGHKVTMKIKWAQPPAPEGDKE